MMEALISKLLAYEHEMIQQSHVEEIEKKRKGIPLKVNSSKEDYKDSSNSEEKAENFNLMVKKFGKFLKSKDKKFSKSSMKIENNNNNNFTCFKCGN